MISLPPISTEITASLAPLRESLAGAQNEVRKAAKGIEDVHMRMYSAAQGAADIEQAKMTANAMKAVASEQKGVLESLKGNFGRGSTFYEMGHLMEGAGPILGIGVVSHILSEATDQAAKLVDQYREGAISGSEMADSIAKSIPILGGIYSAGQNIREMITGEEASIRQMTDEANAVSAAVDNIRHAWDLSALATAAADAEVAKIQERIAQMLHPSGQFTLEFNHQISDAMKQAGDQAKKVNDDIKSKWGAENKAMPALGGMSSLDEMKARIQKLTMDANRPIPALQSSESLDQFGNVHVTDNSDEVAAAKKAHDDAKRDIGLLQNAVKGYQDSIKSAWLGEAKVADMAAVGFATSWMNTIAAKIREMKMAADKQTADAMKPINDAKKALAEFSMSESQRKLRDYSQQPGVTQSQIDQYKKLLDQLDAKKAGAELGKKIADAIGDEIKKFTDWWHKGVKDIAGTKENLDAHFADVMRANSSDAIKLQFAARMDAGGYDVKSADFGQAATPESAMAELRRSIRARIAGMSDAVRNTDADKKDDGKKVDLMTKMEDWLDRIYNDVVKPTFYTGL